VTRRSFLASVAAAGAASGSEPRTSMGITTESFPSSRSSKTVYEFLEYCHSLGAGGVQAGLASLEPDYIKKVRQRVEELGMYLQVMANPPKGDTAAFERTVKAAKEAGAYCLRGVCLNGRRYEVFSNLDDWKRFVAESKARIERTVPILEKHRMTLALENHKDWTADEMAALMKEYSSEYLGVCLDTGNNISLLDDPLEVVERLAPYAAATHMKDVAVEEYPEGFLLVEVPFGEGMLDLKRIVETISKARPKTRFTLEMLTRDPLKIPCLTGKYWNTFPDRNGSYLARTLAMVRTNKPRRPLPQPESLDRTARARLEEDNVRKCLAYARDQLGLYTARLP
jgi:sugar phosphate isomerase/epimerase